MSLASSAWVVGGGGGGWGLLVLGDLSSAEPTSDLPASDLSDVLSRLSDPSLRSLARCIQSLGAPERSAPPRSDSVGSARALNAAGALNAARGVGSALSCGARSGAASPCDWDRGVDRDLKDREAACAHSDAACSHFDTSLLTTILDQTSLLRAGAYPVLICTIAPSHDSIHETEATLAMAEVARGARKLRRASADASLLGVSARLRAQLEVEERRAAEAAVEAAEAEAEAAAAMAAAEARAAAAESAVEAMSRARAASEARERQLHAEFALEARVLGALSQQQGQHEMALRLHQRARRLHEEAHGPRHAEVARDMSHVGNAYYELGRFDEAFDTFTEAHALDAHLLGAGHAHTATALASLGLVLVAQQKWAEALPFLEESLGVLKGAGFSNIYPFSPYVTPHSPHISEFNSIFSAALEEPQHERHLHTVREAMRACAAHGEAAHAPGEALPLSAGVSTSRGSSMWWAKERKSPRDSALMA